MMQALAVTDWMNDNSASLGMLDMAGLRPSKSPVQQSIILSYQDLRFASICQSCAHRIG